MKKWRSPSLVVIALLALFVSTLPSLAWSCPVTGRIGNAATVCKGMTPPTAAATAQPCARPGSKCCHQVPLPTLPNNSDDNQKVTSAVFSTNGMSDLVSLLADHGKVGHIAAVLPTSPSVVPPPLDQVFLKNNPPPSFLLQHRPAAVSGRAPPLF